MAIHRCSLFWILCALIGASFGTIEPEPIVAQEKSYDPLRVDAAWKPVTHNLDVKDEARSREIPVRVYLPADSKAAPVVIFSHGLGGSRNNNPYLGNHWSARGYVVVFIQHHGSDETVWRDEPVLQRMAALKQAANLQNTLLRFQDVKVVLDQLTAWQKTEGSPLKGRLDLDKVGMTGHSFGAVTTQGVSGQRTPRGESPFLEKRIKAALPMSPSAPRLGDPKQAFAGVTIPWLLMTGTRDGSPIGEITPESRLEVFPALPAGQKYELVLHDAEHSAFGDRNLPGENGKRNPNHHRVILALSTAFWDAYLKQDAAAKQWLDGDGPKSVMETADRWQKK